MVLRTEPLAKVRVICHNSSLKKVVGLLHKEKALHVVEHSKGELDIGKPFPENSLLSEISVKLDFLISQLFQEGIALEADRKIYRKLIDKYEIENLDKLKKRTEALFSSLKEKLEKKKELEKKKALLFSQLSVFRMLREFGVSAENLRDSESLCCIIGTVSDDSFEDKLSKITKAYEFDSHRKNGGKVVLIYAEKSKKQEIIDMLSAYNFQQLSVPDGFRGSLQKIVSRLDKSYNSTDASIDKLNRELTAFKLAWESFLLAAKKHVSVELEKSDFPLKLASTDSIAVITGWVPEKKLRLLEEKIKKATNEAVVFEAIENADVSEMPIKLKNPVFARPFEWFMRLYSLPKFNELDPTLFMFITFPIYFGFMLGDVGYGLLTLFLFKYLKKKMPSAKALLNAMIWCSVWSIVFGFAFGEFFGFEYYPESLGKALCSNGIYCVEHHAEAGHGSGAEVVYSFPRLLARSHGINELLSISLIIGVFHVLLGLIAGFINIYIQHGLKHAIKEKLGWILIVPGIIKILMILGLIQDNMVLNLIAGSDLAVIAMAGLGVLLIVLGEGMIGAIELPGILSNVVSYGRLMAVGLASVSLAIVVDEFTVDFFKHGSLLMALFGIMIFAAGHAINIALGIIGPFLHSLRLHYVEFFTKFFKGGGEPFKPFGVTEED